MKWKSPPSINLRAGIPYLNVWERAIPLSWKLESCNSCVGCGKPVVPVIMMIIGACNRYIARDLGQPTCKKSYRLPMKKIKQAKYDCGHKVLLLEALFPVATLFVVVLLCHRRVEYPLFPKRKNNIWRAGRCGGSIRYAPYWCMYGRTLMSILNV